MIEYLYAVISISLVVYLLIKSKPVKGCCPGQYVLYITLMGVVAVINTLLSKLLLTTLVPVLEESFKITGARLTPAKNRYVFSGIIFGALELISYVLAVPTLTMLVTRSAVLFIHPTTMLTYSLLRKKVNSAAGFFAAVTIHELWNSLMVTYPYEGDTITGLFLVFAIIITLIARGEVIDE